MSAQPLVMAHAACKGHAPENTLAGIRAALNLGVDAIEIDVHCTADRVPVLCHDATVDRTTGGTGAIANLTLEQIRVLDAGCRGFDGRFTGERIPMLAETLDLTRGRCLLIIEIKAQGIEREVVDVAGSASDDVMAWSFQPGVVQRMRELAPAIPCALLSPPLPGPPDELFRRALAIGQQGVSVYHMSVNEALVRAAALRGLTVFTWTADEPEDHRRLIEAGVAGIVTNVPDVLARELGRMASAS
jgi:glycerophosphoryl diester phosphodiesterase